jgi:hypothetical protein
MINIGIGIPFIRRKSGAAIDAQAQAHFDRVIADGGVVPSGLSGVNAFFTTVKSIYATSDITTAISVGLDAQVLGYKLGAGAGTTLGQAAQKLYSCSGSSGDVVQTTAASQPLLLVHEGANYWFGSGVTGNFCSTPNSVANSNNGNKEIIVKFSTNDTTSFSDIVSKDEVGSNRAYAILYDHSNQRFSLVLTTDLQSTTVVNTDSGTILRNYSGWYKVTMTFSGGVLSIRTFESLDNITYTQVGSTITRNGNNFIGTDAILNIGSRSTTSGSCIAKIDRVTISNSIGGAPVVDFNPNQYNASTSQTQWTSSTGEVWTINTGTAATGYKGVLVDRTIVQGDGVDDTLMSGTLTNYQYISRYMALTPYTMNSSGGRLIAGTGNGHLLYNFNTGILRAFSGSDLDYSGEVINRVQLFTANFNSSSSTILVNNANSVSGDTGTNISSILALFSSANPNQYSNCLINTIIQATSVNNSTQNTSMYNLLKSINNSAF